LGARMNDAASQEWAIALKARFDPKPEARAAIGRYERALSRDRDNAIIRCWMGEAYMRLGEAQLALGQWRYAAALMPSWARPYELISAAELVEGREPAALDAARAAARRAPTQMSVAVTMALAWNAYRQSNPAAEDLPRLY